MWSGSGLSAWIDPQHSYVVPQYLNSTNAGRGCAINPSNKERSDKVREGGPKKKNLTQINLTA